MFGPNVTLPATGSVGMLKHMERRRCTHRGSQDDKYVRVGAPGRLFSVELLPELPEHLGASRRLAATHLRHRQVTAVPPLRLFS